LTLGKIWCRRFVISKRKQTEILSIVSELDQTEAAWSRASSRLVIAGVRIAAECQERRDADQ